MTVNSDKRSKPHQNTHQPPTERRVAKDEAMKEANPTTPKRPPTAQSGVSGCSLFVCLVEVLWHLQHFRLYKCRRLDSQESNNIEKKEGSKGRQ